MTPLNAAVVNTGLKEDRWGIYKAHCSPMKKVFDDCKATNHIPPIPYDVSIDSYPSYHIKGMYNRLCSSSADHKPHTVNHDTHLGICEAAAIPLPVGVTT